MSASLCLYEGRRCLATEDAVLVELSDHKGLNLYTRDRHPEVNPLPEVDIRRRLIRALASPNAAVDERTTLLLSIARESGLLERNLGKVLATAGDSRIDELCARSTSRYLNPRLRPSIAPITALICGVG